ncbi:sigma-E processing peptidase SpoIIGA [Pelotomaculum terephthalicicum JT]|uniref:sigma-E processing peptidase SpoIIGA n=1 Tax=Pelotomaculum TaxID=191373 RepID=UPI0009D0CCE3|nr:MULTISPECIES: sigma-E processing peptidase SpoIIGA [Pelotomaculum]MCG9968068.1 sigma-E processing peptidase SpoIIGA [Pelotomaculum terephthalicicum JT]OPX85633.1 MAG: Sporulation factor SpoIIGA [Pelotomaculum sp. PtaB.Bin117]OPY63995.1 MAG: Sporulation factor SpoIIGA [Pelotomaculum sp. PtaU1.Bin065]
MLFYTVYLDQVFLGNMVMNYAILWATAKLSRTKAVKGRLAAGAALGAAYTLTLFIPGNNVLLTAWFKLIASVLIIALTFAPLQPKKFFVCLGVFYLTSFVLGGLILGIIFYIQPFRISSINGTGLIVSKNFWPGLLLGIIAFGVMVKVISSLLKKRIMEKVFKLGLFIKSQGIQVQVSAFLDTGNQLIDPMTKRAVIVVEYGVLKPLLPAEVQVLFEQAGEPDVWHILSALSENPRRSLFSVIPFNSLGNSGGLMVGFRPDEVFFEQRGHLVQIKKAVIAVYHKKIDPGNSYNALLHPRLLEM